MTKNITIEDLRNHKKKKTKFACLTAYDASLSRLMSEAGVELILVGDSLGMVVQGHDSTIPVSMEDLLYHLRCVKRGNLKSHIMADMPFMSYATESLAYDNAMRLMQAGANSVKVEGGEWILKTTELLSQRGIPVCAHWALHLNQLIDWEGIMFKAEISMIKIEFCLKPNNLKMQEQR